jgi:hypothetical protein
LLALFGFDDREITAIAELGKRQELTAFQTLRQAVRTYQAVVLGNATVSWNIDGLSLVNPESLERITEAPEKAVTDAVQPEPGWRIAKHDGIDCNKFPCKLWDGRRWVTRIARDQCEPFDIKTVYSVPIEPPEAAATGIPDVETLVCADIMERQKRSAPRYGHTIANNPQNLRAWLVDMYEELLDAGNYAKRAILEIDAKQAEVDSLKLQLSRLREAHDRAIAYLSVEDADTVGKFDDRDE